MPRQRLIHVQIQRGTVKGSHVVAPRHDVVAIGARRHRRGPHRVHKCGLHAPWHDSVHHVGAHGAHGAQHAPHTARTVRGTVLVRLRRGQHRVHACSVRLQRLQRVGRHVPPGHQRVRVAQRRHAQHGCQDHRLHAAARRGNERKQVRGVRRPPHAAVHRNAVKRGHAVVHDAAHGVQQARRHGALVRRGHGVQRAHPRRAARVQHGREHRAPHHVGAVHCGGAGEAQALQHAQLPRRPPVAGYVRPGTRHNHSRAARGVAQHVLRQHGAVLPRGRRGVQRVQKARRVQRHPRHVGPQLQAGLHVVVVPHRVAHREERDGLQHHALLVWQPDVARLALQFGRHNGVCHAGRGVCGGSVHVRHVRLHPKRPRHGVQELPRVVHGHHVVARQLPRALGEVRRVQLHKHAVPRGVCAQLQGPRQHHGFLWQRVCRVRNAIQHHPRLIRRAKGRKEQQARRRGVRVHLRA